MSDRRRHSRERATQALERAVEWLEVAVAAVLAVVIVIAAAVVVARTIGLVTPFPPGNASTTTVLSAVLDVFIIVELFRIAVAYARHREVIQTVLETALVVTAREIVVLQAGKDDPLQALGLAAVLLAVGGAWFLLRRARVRAPGVSEEM